MLMHVSRDDGSARGQLTKQNFRYETPHLHGYVPSVSISAERPKEGSEKSAGSWSAMTSFLVEKPVLNK